MRRWGSGEGDYWWGFDHGKFFSFVVDGFGSGCLIMISLVSLGSGFEANLWVSACGLRMGAWACLCGPFLQSPKETLSKEKRIFYDPKSIFFFTFYMGIIVLIVHCLEFKVFQ